VPTDTIHDLWLAFASTWSSHDLDQVLPLYTDDVHYEDVTFGAVNHGKDELRAFGELFARASRTSTSR
jgi:ketosteroid isomerase-like protein